MKIKNVELFIYFIMLYLHHHLLYLFFKVEEERGKTVSILREKQDVHEQWSELERKFDKLQHDFSVKEAQNHALQVKYHQKPILFFINPIYDISIFQNRTSWFCSSIHLLLCVHVQHLRLSLRNLDTYFWYYSLGSLRLSKCTIS